MNTIFVITFCCSIPGYSCLFLYLAAQVITNPCISVPCSNGGSCLSLEGGSYYCICRNGYRGNNCESAIGNGKTGLFNEHMIVCQKLSKIFIFIFCLYPLLRCRFESHCCHQFVCGAGGGTFSVD